MHIPPFRRLAGEIIPITAFSCAVLLCAAMLRYALLPELAAFRSTAAQLAYFKSLASDRNHNQALRDRLLDKQRQLAAAADRAKTVWGADQTATGLSELLQLLIARAKDADIRFVKMLPQQETQRPDGTGYPVVLETATSYHSLGRFVSSLEELPGILRIDRLAITAQKNGLDVRILVTCFLRKAP